MGTAVRDLGLECARTTNSRLEGHPGPWNQHAPVGWRTVAMAGWGPYCTAILSVNEQVNPRASRQRVS